MKQSVLLGSQKQSLTVQFTLAFILQMVRSLSVVVNIRSIFLYKYYLLDFYFPLWFYLICDYYF